MQKFQLKNKKLAKFLTIVLVVLISAITIPVLSVVNAQAYPPYCCNQPQVRKECAVIFAEKLPPDCKQYSAICLQDEFNCGTPISVTQSGEDFDSGLEDEINVNFFGIRLRLDSDRAVVQLISYGFFAFLAGALLVTIFTIVSAAFERALPEFKNELPPEIQKVVNAILGLVLIILSIVIAQIVATFIGVGSLIEITSTGGILPG